MFCDLIGIALSPFNFIYVCILFSQMVDAAIATNSVDPAEGVPGAFDVVNEVTEKV